MSNEAWTKFRIMAWVALPLLVYMCTDCAGWAAISFLAPVVLCKNG